MIEVETLLSGLVRGRSDVKLTRRLCEVKDQLALPHWKNLPEINISAEIGLQMKASIVAQLNPSTIVGISLVLFCFPVNSNVEHS